MANVLRLQALIGADISAFRRAMSEMRGDMQNTGRSGAASFLKLTAANVAGQAAMSGLRSAFGAVKSAVIDYNATQQQYMIGLTQLMGSQKKASDELQRLQKIANTTPFEMPQLVQGYQRLLAFGMGAADAEKALVAAGDAAAALGKGPEAVQRITLAFGQMLSKGKVQGDEMLQLAEVGINGVQLLAKHFGTTTADIQKKMKSGTLSAKESVKALTEEIEKSNMGGAMAKQATTFNGAMSTIKDMSRQLIGNAFLPLFEIISKVANKVGTWAQSNSAMEKSQAVAAALGAAFKRLEMAIDAVKNSSSNFTDALNHFQYRGDSRLDKIFYDLGQAVNTAKHRFDELKPTISAVFGFIQQNAGVIGAFVGTFLLFQKAARYIDLVTIAFRAMAIAIAANPLFLITGAIIAIGVALLATSNHVKTFGEGFKLAGQFVKDTFLPPLISLGNWAKDHLIPALELLGGVIAITLVNAVKEFSKHKDDFEAIGRVIRNVANIVTDYLVPALAGSLYAAGVAVVKSFGFIMNSIGAVIRFFERNSAAVAALAGVITVAAVPALAALSAWLSVRLVGALAAAYTRLVAFGATASTAFAGLGPLGIAAAVGIGAVATVLMYNRREADKNKQAIKEYADEQAKAFDPQRLGVLSNVTEAYKDQTEAIRNTDKAVKDGAAGAGLASKLKREEAAALDAVTSKYNNYKNNIQDMILLYGLSETSVIDLANANQINLSGSFESVSRAFQHLNDTGKVSNERIQNLNTDFDRLESTTFSAKEKIDAFRDAIDQLNGKNLDLEEMNIRVAQAFNRAKEAVVEAHGKLDGYSDASLTAKQTIIDLVRATQDQIVAYVQVHGTTDGTRGAVERYITQLEGQLRQLGLNETQIKTYTGALHQIPAKVQTDIIMNSSAMNQGLVDAKRKLANVYAGLNIPMPPALARMGDPRFMAEGGVLPRDATIAPGMGRGLIQWAEAETGGEAFIPLGKHKRKRSKKLLAQVADMFGMSVDEKFADGGILAGRPFAHGHIDIDASDPYLKKMNQLFEQATKAAQALGSVFGNIGAQSSGRWVALGQTLAMARGWTGPQFTALNALWTGESNWNPLARNPSSGAFGIPQALPASKMGRAALSGPIANMAYAQINWGLDYIRSVYGNPLNAYRKWLSRSPHWYGFGGKPGAGSWGVVGERGPELVQFRNGGVVTPLSKIFQNEDAWAGRAIPVKGGDGVSIDQGAFVFHLHGEVPDKTIEKAGETFTSSLIKALNAGVGKAS